MTDEQRALEIVRWLRVMLPTYTDAGAAHTIITLIRQARRDEREALLKYRLPCDVKLPPATVITAGVDLGTLIKAMDRPYRAGEKFNVPGLNRTRTDTTEREDG